MSRTDWYGGLRWVTERNVGGDIPASVAVRCVLEASEASDRLRADQPAPPITHTFTPHENALWRALADRFPPDKCTELVLRAREAAGEIVDRRS